jgi:hypothetical protein
MSICLSSVARDMNSCAMTFSRPGKPIQFTVRGLSAAEVERITAALGPWPEPPPPDQNAKAEAKAAFELAHAERSTLQDAAYVALASGMTIDQDSGAFAEALAKGPQAAKAWVVRFRESVKQVFTGPETRTIVSKVVELCGAPALDRAQEKALGKSSSPPAPASA